MSRINSARLEKTVTLTRLEKDRNWFFFKVNLATDPPSRSLQTVRRNFFIFVYFLEKTQIFNEWLFKKFLLSDCSPQFLLFKTEEITSIYFLVLLSSQEQEKSLIHDPWSSHSRHTKVEKWNYAEQASLQSFDKKFRNRSYFQ